MINKFSIRPAVLPLTAAIAATLLSVGSVQAEDSAGWYGAIGVGRSHSKIDGGAIDGALANQGITSSTGSNANDTAYKFELGYRLNPNLALEAGYVDLGKSKWDSNVGAPAADTLSGQNKSSGETFSVLGIAPLGNGFSAYGKVGLIRAKVDLSGGSTGGGGTVFSNSSSTTTKVAYGLGAGYDFSRHLGARLEWDRYDNLGTQNATGKGNLDLVTAALVYKF